eukprot:5335883-Heterocapsa_arctica.AAC.1
MSYTSESRHSVQPIGHSNDTSPPLLMIAFARILKLGMSLQSLSTRAAILALPLAVLSFRFCQGDPAMRGIDIQMETCLFFGVHCTAANAHLRPASVVIFTS